MKKRDIGTWIAVIDSRIKRAHWAFSQIQKCNSIPPGGGVRDIAELTFSSLHTYLTNTTMVSRILSPGTTKSLEITDLRIKSSTELRNILNVPEDAYIFQRRMRNFVEHFDEYLEEKMLNYPKSAFLFENIGRPEYIDSGSILAVSSYDPDRNICHFFAHEYDLNRAHKELLTIKMNIMKSGYSV